MPEVRYLLIYWVGWVGQSYFEWNTIIYSL